jgi:hypothetical protein
LLETPYNAADVWALRNSWETGNNNASSLYGWRQGGDYGLLGSPGSSTGPPSTGTYVPYPTYFAEQLASKIIRSGGKVVQASSNNTSLSAYAVLESNGHLELLVINKSAASALAGTFKITNFQPAAQAVVWRYGEAQDTAQSKTSDGHSALAHFNTTLTLNGSSLTYSFPKYSMTVLDLGPATGTATAYSGSGPALGNAAAASRDLHPAAGTTMVTAGPSATDLNRPPSSSSQTVSPVSTASGAGPLAVQVLEPSKDSRGRTSAFQQKSHAVSNATRVGSQWAAHLTTRRLPAMGRRRSDGSLEWS